MLTVAIDFLGALRIGTGFRSPSTQARKSEPRICMDRRADNDLRQSLGRKELDYYIFFEGNRYLIDTFI
jgi:hypothetical protein